MVDFPKKNEPLGLNVRWGDANRFLQSAINILTRSRGAKCKNQSVYSVVRNNHDKWAGHRCLIVRLAAAGKNMVLLSVVRNRLQYCKLRYVKGLTNIMGGRGARALCKWHILASFRPILSWLSGGNVTTVRCSTSPCELLTQVPALTAIQHPPT